MEEEQLTKKEKNFLKKEEKMETRDGEQRSKITKKIIKWVVILAVIILGIWWAKAASQQEDGANTVIEDHFKGGAEASATLIEYSDFQCPACAAYFPLVSQLSADYGVSIKIVYRHFPLSSIHPNAQAAAQAAEAAGLAGKFWEMHDLLFINQREWSNQRGVKDTFVNYAEGLGLNREQFLQDYNNKSVKAKISHDQNEGQRLRVQGTPSFFLNSQFIQPRSYQEFVQLVEQAGAVRVISEELDQNGTSTESVLDVDNQQ